MRFTTWANHAGILSLSADRLITPDQPAGWPLQWLHAMPMKVTRPLDTAGSIPRESSCPAVRADGLESESQAVVYWSKPHGLLIHCRPEHVERPNPGEAIVIYHIFQQPRQGHMELLVQRPHHKTAAHLRQDTQTRKIKLMGTLG